MRTDISIKESQIPLWQNDLIADRAFGIFMPMSMGLLGVNRKPADFPQFLVVSLCTTIFACCLVFTLYFFSSRKDLITKYEYRLNRIARGWRSRIDNNLRVFTVAGISIANINFVIFSLFGLVLYSYWHFLLISLVISYIYGLFFTVTTALLDFRAQGLSDS